ncbi:MAG: hypothetical protein QXM96_01635 [Candidatus Woesearchaeota archaeon]
METDNTIKVEIEFQTENYLLSESFNILNDELDDLKNYYEKKYKTKHILEKIKFFKENNLIFEIEKKKINV